MTKHSNYVIPRNDRFCRTVGICWKAPLLAMALPRDCHGKRKPRFPRNDTICKLSTNAFVVFTTYCHFAIKSFDHEGWRSGRWAVVLIKYTAENACCYKFQGTRRLSQICFFSDTVYELNVTLNSLQATFAKLTN